MQAQVTTAQAQISSADAALANLPGSSAADLQAARSAYDQAASQLQSAQAALSQNMHPTQAATAQAESTLAQAQAQHQQAEASQTALEQSAAAPCVNSPLSPHSTACGAARASADSAVQA